MSVDLNETDSRIADLALKNVYDLYAADFKGFDLLGATPDHADAPAVEASARAALGDLMLLVTAVEEQRKARKGTWKWKLKRDQLKELRAHGFASADLAAELARRIQTGWPKVPPALRNKVAKDLQLVKVEPYEPIPKWDTLRAMLEALESCNAGSADDPQCYAALLESYEQRSVDAWSAQAAPPPRPTAPPESEMTAYSTKSTFEVGQWIRHPTFGHGYVTEASDNIVVAFESGQRRLAHTRPAGAVLETANERAKARFQEVDVIEVAKAQGVVIQKLPPVVRDDD